jgi:hypothetical protein
MMAMVGAVTVDREGRKVRMTPEVLKMRFQNAKDARDGAARAYDELRAAARAAGLDRLFAELEAPPAPPPAQKPEKLIRVRVHEGFSGEWNNRPIYAIQGQVLDVPVAYFKRARHLFEKVDPATPIFAPSIPS